MRHVLAGVLILTAGCHRNRAGELAQACVPAEATFLAASSVGAFAGTHEVTFVATSGPRSGHALKADLILRDQPDSARSSPRRYVGTLDVTPEDIGAVRMGEPTSTDPARPGIGIYLAELGGALTITGRVGALSNMGGESAIDAGYFALHVREVTDGMIRGHWVSGDGRDEVAAGHFCARRR